MILWSQPWNVEAGTSSSLSCPGPSLVCRTRTSVSFVPGKGAREEVHGHLLHHFPHCMRCGSANRPGDTLSPTYLCFTSSAEAHISLSKLPFEVLNQMVSADEGLEAKQGDSGGSQTEQVSFPRMHCLSRPGRPVGSLISPFLPEISPFFHCIFTDFPPWLSLTATSNYKTGLWYQFKTYCDTLWTMHEKLLQHKSVLMIWNLARHPKEAPDLLQMLI